MKKASEMTKEERVAELKRLFTTPENKLRPKEFETFDDLWKRINKLVGRSTMTHELAFPDLLYEEIMSGKAGNPLGEALVRATKLTKSKKAILVVSQTIEGIPLGVKAVGVLDLSKDKKPSEEQPT